MSLVIGLSSRFVTEDHVEKQCVNTRYINRLVERGLNTLMLTIGNPNLEHILSMCDGFLITGGNDINPVSYHEINEGLSKDTDIRLDQLDIAIIFHALKYRKPLLGICRGLQILNVALGGTLYQDLCELNKTHLNIPFGHIVYLNDHPYFAWSKSIDVNSFHHQAIKDLADDLVVYGRSEDGIIELVVHKTHPIFALQWHPEMSPDNITSHMVFDAFVNMFDLNTL